MLNKLVLIFIVIMLPGCVLNPLQQSGQVAQQQVPAYPLTNRQDIRMVQQRLKNRGFNPGGIDGIMGQRTTKAIRSFQRNEGYPVDGLATTRLLKQLTLGYVAPSKDHQQGYDSSIAGKSTAQAAVVCGAIGAVGGGLAGGKETAVVAGTASAAACALADMAANWFRIDQAEKEQNLNLSLDQVRKENKDLKRMINNTKQLIKEDKAKINQIKRQLVNNKISKQNAKKKFAQVDKNREQLRGIYDGLLAKKKEREGYAKNNNTSQDLDYEMKKLNVEIASLKIQLDELDQLLSIPVTG